MNNNIGDKPQKETSTDLYLKIAEINKFFDCCNINNILGFIINHYTSNYISHDNALEILSNNKRNIGEILGALGDLTEKIANMETQLRNYYKLINHTYNLIDISKKG